MSCDIPVLYHSPPPVRWPAKQLQIILSLQLCPESLTHLHLGGLAYQFSPYFKLPQQTASVWPFVASIVWQSQLECCTMYTAVLASLLAMQFLLSGTYQLPLT